MLPRSDVSVVLSDRTSHFLFGFKQFSKFLQKNILTQTGCRESQTFSRPKKSNDPGIGKNWEEQATNFRFQARRSKKATLTLSATRVFLQMFLFNKQKRKHLIVGEN